MPDDEKLKKDFKKWFALKPKLEDRFVPDTFSFKEGQIWWCSLGVNIGIEIDGKNDFFERPVLIFQIFTRPHVLVIPISSEGYEDHYHIPIRILGRESFIILSQIRTISSRRLLEKLDAVTPDEFKMVRIRLKEML
jgi:mRNA interferase MazF